jgi:hypothetical protein
MKRQALIQTQKETMPPQMRERLSHAAVRAAPDNDMPSNGSAETSFNHDFSQIPARPLAPVNSHDYANTSCPIVPQRCPFGGACHTCPPRAQAKLKVGQLGDKYEHQPSAPARNFGKITVNTPSRWGNSFISLTTGNDDEEMFQTAVDTAPINLFDTELLGPVGSTPGPTVGPSIAARHYCVPTVVSSSLPSGHIAATVSGGRFAAPFTMTADFETPIPCNGICGEYRQFVSGYSQVNGTDIVHPLCSNNMSRTTEYEDCKSSGGTTLKYGYHSIPFSTSRFTNPDQATGWSYRGYDAPGFNLASFPSGTVLNWNLSFRGELVDACDGDTPLQSSATWTAGGSHTIP